MTDGIGSRERVPAHETRSRWPGLVWAVPLAALIVAGYLAFRAFTERGVEVVVTFPSADGVKAGTTRVVYQGIEAGKVEDVDLNKDGRRVDVTLSLIPRAKPVLVTGTVFFLIGEKPNLADPSSLRSAISGVTIGAFPSHSGTPTRHFVGLESQPAIAPETPGTRITLWSRDIGSVKPETKVTYHGTTVGKVVGTGVVGAEKTRVDAFVQAPFDRLLRPDSVFWDVGALDVGLSSAGVSAKVNPDAVLSGEIAFSTPDEPSAPTAGGKNAYTLFGDESRARSAIRGPEVPYEIRFPAAVGGIVEGAPISLGGIPVGLVRRVRFRIDEGTGGMSTTMLVGLSPRALSLDAAGLQPPDYWRRRTDAVLGRMAARGWRIALRQSPPVIGARTLEFHQGGKARLTAGSIYPELPVESDEGDPVGKADRLLDTLNRLPIAAIGANVERATSGIARLASSPKLVDAVSHADGALRSADAMLAEARPKIGPLLATMRSAATKLDAVAANAAALTSGDGPGGASLPAAVREVTDAARSLRALSDYLERHPEAVLTGKRGGKERP